MATEAVVLPLRVVYQPEPNLNSGGDCGACVLAGLIGMKPVEVYNLFTGGKRQSFDYYKMRQALYDGEAEGLFDRIVVSHPTWPVTDALSTWGATSIQQSYDWFLYVRMALDAGYYGLAMVDFRKCGLFGQGPDHWVLLCGAREVFDATKKCTNWEVMVSCSAKASPDEEWVGVGDFLKDRGGFNLFLARPSAK